MLSLIKKELTANTQYMLLGLAFFILYAFLFAGNGGELFMLCLIIFFYSISTTNLMLDERYKIDLLLSTFPLRRKTVVESKYILLVLVFLAGVVLYTLLAFAGRALGFGKIPVLDWESAMFGLLILSLFNAVMLPLCYKFGAQATRYVSFVMFFIVFFLNSLLGSLDLSKYTEFLRSLNGMQTGLLLLTASLVINIVSFFITFPIYEKKDL
jgi:hypothetical protein